jgi:hypothetical protein
MDKNGKKRYQKPRLTRFGNLRTLTKGGGGNKKEPGNGPKSRAGGFAN